jgi:hypothetical protein
MTRKITLIVAIVATLASTSAHSKEWWIRSYVDPNTQACEVATNDGDYANPANFLDWAATAAEQTRIYDARGRSVGTATPSTDGSITFRDSQGRTIGTATSSSDGTTIYRDSRGNRIGTAAPPPARR